MCLSTTPTLFGMPHPNSLIGKFNNRTNNLVKDRICLIRCPVWIAAHIVTTAATVSAVAISSLKFTGVMLCTPALAFFSSGRSLIGRVSIELLSSVACLARSVGVVSFILLHTALVVFVPPAFEDLINGRGPEILNLMSPNSLQKQLSSYSQPSLGDARRLIEYGADVNHVNENGKTPLSYAIENNAPEFVKFLLENGADPNLQSPLFLAFGEGIYSYASYSSSRLVTIIKTLIKAGANTNETKNNESILDLAIKSDNEELIIVLADAGIDINQTDSSGNITTFSRNWSTWGNCESLLRLLKTGRLKVNHANHQGERALDRFLQEKGVRHLPEIVTGLIKAGATVDYKLSDGTTPLQVFVSRMLEYSDLTESKKIIKELILTGAEFNNLRGSTSRLKIVQEAAEEIVTQEVLKHLPLSISSPFLPPFVENLNRTPLSKHLEKLFQEEYTQIIAPFYVEAEMRKFLPPGVISKLIPYEKLNRTKFPELIESLFLKEYTQKYDLITDPQKVFEKAFNAKDISLIKQAVTHGADVNKYLSEESHTPLYGAILDGAVETIKALIALNANVNLGASNGKTPLCLAKKMKDQMFSFSANKYQSIINLLIQNGAKEATSSQKAKSENLFRHSIQQGLSNEEEAITYFKFSKEDAPAPGKLPSKTIVSKYFKLKAILVHPDKLKGDDKKMKELVRHRDTLNKAIEKASGNSSDRLEESDYADSPQFRQAAAAECKNQ